MRHFITANRSISDIRVSTISPISVIAVKYRENVSFLKLESSIRAGWKNDFLLFDPFIVSVFVQHVRTKAVTSHFYFCILLIMYYYAFVIVYLTMIGLFSVTWLFLLYKFIRFLIHFLFLSDEGPTLETWDFTIRIGSTPTFFYISTSIF